MSLTAAETAAVAHRSEPTAYAAEEARSLVVAALHSGAPTAVVQPVLGLATGRVVGYEALARFSHGGPALTPDRWFAMAHRVGLGAMLEARAVERALTLGQARPAGTWLSVNVSPSVLGSRELDNVLPLDLSGLQLEITETEAVEDAAHMAEVIAAIRARGGRIAVDDVGEGYAGLQRVMALSPDMLKLDRSLVTGVESQPGKAAMVQAVVTYASSVGATVCAEGVESLEDLYTLTELDVSTAQGWVIGMPQEAFAGASEASQLTCVSSFARALAVGGRGTDAAVGPTLEHLIGRLADTADLDSLARLMVVVAQVLGCEAAELSFLDDTGEWLEAVEPDGWRPEGVRYSLSEYVTSREVLVTQQMNQVLMSAPESDAHEIAWMQSKGWRSLMLVPAVSAGRAVGLLECCNRQEIAWTRQQVRQARAIASVLGPVLDNLLHDRS